jgi:hypothetical protein
MDAMNMNPLNQLRFAVKFKDHNPKATEEEVEDAYNKYKEFFYKYHQENPAATTDCYAQYLETLDKQGKQHTFIGRIEEQRGEEFEYCYWFCAILQEREAVGSY